MISKIKCLGLVCVVLLNICIPVSFAANVQPIEPQYVAVGGIMPTLTISNGKANCRVSVSAKPNYSLDVTLQLQKDNGSGWTSVASWNEQGSINVGIDKTKYVTSGYDYRLKVTVKVYDSANNLVEQPSKYSAVVHY